VPLDPAHLKAEVARLKPFLPKARFESCLELQQNQKKINELHSLRNDKQETLRKDFYEKLKPLQRKRVSILQQKSKAPKQDVEEDDESEPQLPVVGVPGYWLRILQNCNCRDTLKDRDEEALLSLYDISVETNGDDLENAVVHFHFAKNEFFDDKTITKRIFSLEGTDIGWKEGKNLTRKSVGNAKKKGGKKNSGDDSKEKAVASFFQLFSTPDAGSKYIDQQREMLMEMAVFLLEDDEATSFEIFLGGYGSVDELLDAVQESPEEFEECFSQGDVQERIRSLMGIDEQIKALLKAREEDEAVLQQKLHNDSQEFFSERAEILDSPEDERPRRFWMQVLLSDDHAAHFMGERDERILRYIKDVRHKQDNDGSVFELHFWENPYIANSVLDRKLDAEGVLLKSVKSSVEWKQDDNGDSMQLKISKNKKGKTVESIIWAFDSGKGPCLSQNDATFLHEALAHRVIPFALYMYCKTPDAVEDGDDLDDESEEVFEDSEDSADSDDKDAVQSKAKSLQSKRAKKAAEAKEKQGLFGTQFTLLHLFLVMILTSQVLAFFF